MAIEAPGMRRVSVIVLAPALAAGLLVAGCQSTALDAGDNAALPSTISDAAPDAVAPVDEAAAATEGPDGPEGVDTATNTASVKQDANSAESYVPPKPGTILTWRNNWSTLPPVISYKVAGLVSVGDRKYLKMTSVGGLGETVNAYYDTQNFALKGYRDAKDKAIVTFKPVEERYRFPLKPGDKWVTAWKSYDHRKKQETDGGGIVEVMGMETIKLPAGTFRAIRVKMPLGPGLPRGMQHYVWFSPQLGVTVKEQIGNGSMNWTQILEKVQLPEG
jgi:hypothetical protein